MCTANNFEKYEQILRQIEEEQQKYDQRKKELQTCRDNLQVFQILHDYADFSRKHLFKVKVKWFESIYDFIDIYPEKINSRNSLELTLENTNCYFYIEVFVSQQFHEKLILHEWTLDASVTIKSNGEFVRKLCKSLNLKNRTSNPITILIPCENYDDVCVEHIVSVFLSSQEEKYQRLQLDRISLDVSYKFTHKGSIRNQRNTLISDILSINDSYHKCVSEKESDEVFKSNIFCPLTNEHVLKLILQNSCHNLNPSLILNNKENLCTQILVDFEKVHLELNSKSKCLKMSGSSEHLYLLKKYFEKYVEDVRIYKENLQVVPIGEIKDTRFSLQNVLRTNSTALINVYRKYLRITENCVL